MTSPHLRRLDRGQPPAARRRTSANIVARIVPTGSLAYGLPHGRRQPEEHRPSRHRAVRTEHYLYVKYANGEKELYNPDRDPYELESFYPEAGDALKDRLRGRLSFLASCEGPECLSEEGQ